MTSELVFKEPRERVFCTRENLLTITALPPDPGQNLYLPANAGIGHNPASEGHRGKH